MPVERTYGCPDCGGQFRFLHMTPEEPPPEACELCGSRFEDEPEPELSAPKIASGKSEAADKALQDYARSAGISDLNTNLRQGDVAGKPVQNDVTRYMEQTKQMGVGQYQMNAASYVANTRTPGVERLGGRPAMAAIQSGNVSRS